VEVKVKISHPFDMLRAGFGAKNAAKMGHPDE
jgi:hypothetical protein